MKEFLILLVTAIVVCVGNRTQGVHKHRHGKTGHKPERDTGSITLKPGTAKNKLFPGNGTNFRYIGEVKNGLDRVTVVTSIPIPKYSDIEIRPIAKCAILVFPLTVQTAFCRFSRCLHFSCRPRCALVWGMVVRGFAHRDLC